MDRAKKKVELDSLKSGFSDTDIILISHNKGMSVTQANKLRSDLREKGAQYKVTKNTLAKVALKGTPYEDISDLLTGPTGLTTSKDGLSAAKALYEFAKTSGDKLVVLGGFYGGQKLDTKAFETIAKLPSLDEIRGKLVGILYAPGAQLARLASAYATKDQPQS
jgi:large subunit ribosomal protein L10